MLLPTPGDLRAALSRYADAVIEDERRSTPDTIRQREDTAYTLCVMTGVNDVREALSTADALLLDGMPATAVPAPDGGCRPVRARGARSGPVGV